MESTPQLLSITIDQADFARAVEKLVRAHDEAVSADRIAEQLAQALTELVADVLADPVHYCYGPNRTIHTVG